MGEGAGGGGVSQAGQWLHVVGVCGAAVAVSV